MRFITLKRKAFIIRSKYASMLMCSSFIIVLIILLLHHLDIFQSELSINIGFIQFWIIWTMIPCGLQKLGGFFKTKLFTIPRNLFGIMMIMLCIF